MASLTIAITLIPVNIASYFTEIRSFARVIDAYILFSLLNSGSVPDRLAYLL